MSRVKAIVTYKREPITLSLCHPSTHDHNSLPNGFLFSPLLLPSKSLNHSLLAPSMDSDKDNLMHGGPESQFGGSFICHTANRINSRGYWLGENPLAFSVPLFLIQVFIIFIFTRFSHVILKPFGQPSFVSQILVSLFFYHFLS